MKTLPLFAAAFAVHGAAAAANPLPQLNLDTAATTVSGLSSGAFMAVQLQVAFSTAIAGAGIVAGGPCNCAEGSTWQALFVCMDPLFLKADPVGSLAAMQPDTHPDRQLGMAMV